MKNSAKVCRFQATFGKLNTCKEGGIKLTLDVPEIEQRKAVGLMDYPDKIFDIIVTIVEPETIGAG